jgi:tryptophanyl-tRNA synthetase
MKRILLSGIQPTGVIHIGNYLVSETFTLIFIFKRKKLKGFLRHFVSLQDVCAHFYFN